MYKVIYQSTVQNSKTVKISTDLSKDCYSMIHHTITFYEVVKANP